MKTALVTGAKGQDAFYLTKYLLEKDYCVVLTTRNYDKLFIRNLIYEIGEIAHENKNLFFRELSLINKEKISELFNEFIFHEIYNLGGQSNVVESFHMEEVSENEPINGFNNLIYNIQKSDYEIKLFQATSSEMFEDVGREKINEYTKLNPLSPYAIGKAKVHEALINFRDQENLFLVSGIMFNHESPRRTSKYLFGYLAEEVLKISNDKTKKLKISNLNTVRDWGFSADYVDAMWKTLNHNRPDDYIISTGKSYSVKEIIEHSFKIFDLNYEDFVIEEYNKMRSYDILEKYSDPSKIKNILSWTAGLDGKDVITYMINEKKKR